MVAMAVLVLVFRKKNGTPRSIRRKGNFRQDLNKQAPKVFEKKVESPVFAIVEKKMYFSAT